MTKLESLGAVAYTHTQVASKNDVSFANPKNKYISRDSM